MSAHPYKSESKLSIQPHAEMIAQAANTEANRQVRALIVEDSPTQAKLLSISLNRLGIEVECVDTLNSACKRLDQPGIDVVLLDLSLPDSQGINTFYRMRNFDSVIPIVVLTGLDDQNIALEAVKGGAQEYLVKGRASEDSVARCLRYAIERNNAEQRLRASERRTRMIVENALDGFVSFDNSLTIIDWNKHSEQMFGYKREEILGKTINELFAPISVKTSGPVNLGNILATGDGSTLNKRFEMMAITKDGTEFPVEIGLFRVEDPKGEIFGTFINDITERREIDLKRRQMRRELEKRVQQRTADLERSNEELQQFAKIASHDLQEPLRAVQGFAHLLEKRYREKLDKDGAEFIDYILDGTTRMQELVQAVLEHSTIEACGKDVPLTAVRSVLREVETNLGQSIKESHAQIIYGDLPQVPVQRTHLIQLFQNLIGNAVKYRSEKAPRIEIAAELSVDQWLFSVSDNGIGIDSAYAEKIFDMFARLHGRTEYKGTGMGLAICKKIVTANGGRIWMESQPGQGSIFLFTLPTENLTKEEANGRNY
jgi:PAS domain S-box-containing protein